MTDRTRPGTPQTSARATLAGLFVSLLPIALGVGVGVSDSQSLVPSAMQPLDGASVVVSLRHGRLWPLFNAEGDSPEAPQQSTARLFEDGRRLGPPHSVHEEIRLQGHGRHSHWGDVVYFSASDTTDPRTNGRDYQLVRSGQLPAIVAWGWALAVAGGAWLGRWRWHRAGLSASAAVGPLRGLMAALSGILVLTVARPQLLAGAPRLELWTWLLALASATLLAGVCGARLGAGDYAPLHYTGARLLRRLSGSAAAVPQRVASAPLVEAGRRGLALVDAARRGLDRGGSLLLGTAVVTLLATCNVLVETPIPVPTLLAAHDGAVAVILVAFPFLAVGLSRKDRLGDLVGFGTLLALCTLALAARWQDVAFHGNAIGGLLPFSDANGYYNDARRVLEGHAFMWSRRPMFTGLLSVLLAVFDQNLRHAVAALVALNAVSIWLLAREVARLTGVAGGATAGLLLFFYYRVDGGLGTVLTENLGFALGALATTVLLTGARVRSGLTSVAGIALMTAALMCRAGAFLVLPALVGGMWIAFEDHARRRALVSTAAAATVATAFATLVAGNAVIDRSGGLPAFGNFSQTLYGLTVGGKGWGQIYVDHPGAQEGAEMYALADRAFRARPAGIVEGSLKMWREYLHPAAAYHAFAFVRDPAYRLALQRACFVLAIVGAITCIWRRRDPWRSIVLAAAGGHLASIPFAAPIDAGLRVYAATVPFVVLLVAAGVGDISRVAARVARRPQLSGLETAARTRSATALALGLVLVTSALVVPPGLLYWSHRPAPIADSCGPGLQLLQVRVPSNGYLKVSGDDGPRQVSATGIRSADLARTLSGPLGGEAPHAGPGTVLVNTHDERQGWTLFIFSTEGLLPTPVGHYTVCAKASSDVSARNQGAYIAESVRPVGQ